MKSVALIIWLLLPNGQEQIVERSHFDDLAACQARAAAILDRHAREGRKGRYLCHAVVEEVGGVDENGNPL